MDTQKAARSVLERYEAQQRANANSNLIFDLKCGRINAEAENHLRAQYGAGRMHPKIVPHFLEFKAARDAARSEIFSALMSSAARMSAAAKPAKTGKAAVRS